jgi:hypothetical protein
VNERLGITSAAPGAKLEIKQPATATTTQVQPNAQGATNNEWVADDDPVHAGSTRYQRVNELNADDATSYVQDSTVLGRTFSVLLPPVTAVASTDTVRCKTRVRWTGASSGTVGATFTLALFYGGAISVHTLTTNITGSGFAGDTGWVDMSFDLSPSEITGITSGGGWSSLYIAIDTSGGGTGYAGTCYITWMQLVTIAGSPAVDLIDLYDTSSILISGITSAGTFFFKTGAAAGLQLTSDANGLSSWTAASLLSVSHGDTLAGTVVLGDLIHGNSTPKWSRLVGNTTSTKKFLTQTGNGSISAVPAWGTIALADLPGTRVEIEWIANGPFPVDTDVDGGFTAPSAMTIIGVRMYRTTAGSSGSTILDVNKNGTTMYTTQANRPTMAFNQSGNKIQATLPDVVSIAAGDVITVDTDQIEGGSPANWRLVIEAA